MNIWLKNRLGRFDVESHGPTVLKAAVKLAADRGVRGGKVTPFLLEQVAAQTGGDALRANIVLLRRNAAFAAQLAAALAPEP